MVYGVHGVGKSTFGAMAEKPIFIQTEDGLGVLDVTAFPKAQTYDEVIQALSALGQEVHWQHQLLSFAEERDGIRGLVAPWASGGEDEADRFLQRVINA